MHYINVKLAHLNRTQENTAAAVKVDKLDIQLVYQAYNSNSNDFKTKCIEWINNSSGTAANKRKFTNALTVAKTKEKMLTIINNYWLAGIGLKV